MCERNQVTQTLDSHPTSLLQSGVTPHIVESENHLNSVMKKSLILPSLGIILIGFSACNSKVETSQNAALESKADALDHKAAVVRKNSTVDAADQIKQTSMEADAATAATKASGEAEKKDARQTAVIVRQSGEQAAQALEEKAKETRDQKSTTSEVTPTP